MNKTVSYFKSNPKKVNIIQFIYVYRLDLVIAKVMVIEVNYLPQEQ